MLIAPDQRTQIARLFGFLMQGEYLAHDCAQRQATLTSNPRARRFLVAQARQEAFHAKVFESAVAWLAPRHVNSSPGLTQLVRYRTMIEDALRRADLAESLLAQQVILEGLGDVVFNRISAGMTERGIGLIRLRRMLMNQECAHHTFGLHSLDHLIATGSASIEALRPKAAKYLALVHAIFMELGDLFEVFEEDPQTYHLDLQRTLPVWLNAEAT